MDRYTSADRNVSNMAAMLMRRGINAADFVLEQPPALVARAVGDCQRCTAGQVCQDWLARTGTGIARVPAFCPNADRLEVVAVFAK